MTQREFAKLLGVSQGFIFDCEKSGMVVRNADGKIDPEESKRLMIERRGSLKPMTREQAQRKARKNTPWGRGPHCKTDRAKNIWEELRAEG